MKNKRGASSAEKRTQPQTAERLRTTAGNLSALLHSNPWTSLPTLGHNVKGKEEMVIQEAEKGCLDYWIRLSLTWSRYLISYFFPANK